MEKRNITNIDDRINYIGESENANTFFSETVNLFNNKDYLFERRGFYSNPKTFKLIQEISDVNPSTNH
jgi:hypothetical protein